MLNRSIKWLAGVALAAAAVAAVPSFSEAHAHYTGTMPPSLMALTATTPKTHARTLAHRTHKLTASKKSHKLSTKKHHTSKKHRKSSAAKQKSL